MRLVILTGRLLTCIAYVMRYAAKVKADPSHSVVAKQRDAHRRIFLSADDGEFTEPELTGTQKLVLVLFFATFAVVRALLRIRVDISELTPGTQLTVK